MVSVGLFVMTVSSAKTSEPIKMPFEMCTEMGPRNHVLDGVQIPTCEEAILMAKRGRLRTCPTVDKLKVTQQEAKLAWCSCQLGCTRCGCTLAPPGEYYSTICVCRRCGLMSNYFDYLLNFETSSCLLNC